jgi:hypothetical protein
MNNLTIKGFVNEMSYDLSMQELERLVVDYQDVIIDYFVNNQYNFKVKREFNEVCELLRSDKFFKTLAALIQTDDSRIKFDMAYILYTITHYLDDPELKHEAFMLGYKLREVELGMNITGHKETDISILISAVKTIRSYDVTPFFRSKEIENILENLPEVLYNAYHREYTVNAINENVLMAILTSAVPGLQPEEFVSACCKTNLAKDMDARFKPYASRIQSFLYKVIGLLSEEKLTKALQAACNSIVRFNERTHSNETLIDKYLNYKLLEAVVYSKDTKVPELMKQAYTRMTEFKVKNQKFSHLF